MSDYCNVDFYGTDAQGRPIQIFRVDGHKMKEMYGKLSLDDFFQIQLMLLERLERIVFPMCSQRAGHRVGTLL